MQQVSYEALVKISATIKFIIICQQNGHMDLVKVCRIGRILQFRRSGLQ